MLPLSTVYVVRARRTEQADGVFYSTLFSLFPSRTYATGMRTEWKKEHEQIS